MKHHHRIPLMLCSLCATSLSIVAQNTTNLPTSMYGIGELSTSDGGRYAGMGNIGIALNKPGFQNTLNPAAITRMDSTCLYLMSVHRLRMPAILSRTITVPALWAIPTVSA